jgi:hypothetical protein
VTVCPISAPAQAFQSRSPAKITQCDCLEIDRFTNMITNRQAPNARARRQYRPVAPGACLPVLLLLERMYLEKPVHGFGSSGQHRP